MDGDRIDTIGEIGRIAGCSRQTARYVQVIVKHADPDILDKLRAGKLSIFGVFRRIEAELKGQQVPPLPSPEDPPVNGQHRQPGRLTVREMQVMSLLSAGKKEPEIATEIGIAPSTVHDHVMKAFRTLGCSRREDAIAKCREMLPEMMPKPVKAATN